MRFWVTVAVFAVLNLCAWLGYHHWLQHRELLRVVEFAPGDGATIGADATIAWRFNLPMAPGDLEREPPVLAAPALAGSLRWADDYTLVLRPSSPAKATRYALTLLPERLRSRAGFRLAAPFAAAVQTPALRVERVADVDCLPDGRYVIELEFSARVLPAEALAHLEVADAQGHAIGVVQYGESSERILRVATEPLARRADIHPPLPVTVTVRAGLAGSDGPLGLAEDHVRNLVLDTALRLVEVEGEVDTGETTALALSFNHFCAAEALREVLRVEPPLPFAIVGEGSRIRLEGAFACGTRYAAVIGPPPAKTAAAPGTAPTVARAYPLPDTVSVLMPDRRSGAWFEHDDGYLGSKGNRAVLAHAVNLRALKVEVHRLYDTSLVEWRSGGDVARLGRPLVEKTLVLAGAKNRIEALRLGLDELLPPELARDGVYRVALSWRAEDALDDRDGQRSWWERRTDQAVVTLSDLALSARLGRDALTVWAVSLASARPTPGARVRLFSNKHQPLGEGVADADGLASVPLPPAAKDEWPALVVADLPGLDGGAATGLTWLALHDRTLRDPLADTGGRPYLRGGYEAFVYADRGVYRPGETAHLRAIVRGPEGSTPPPFPARWRVLRPDLRAWRDQVATTGEDGVVDWDLDLPADLPTGAWTVLLGLPGEGTADFGRLTLQIEDYVPDRLAVGLDFAGAGLAPAADGQPQRLRAAAGELVATIHGDWLFGQPAAGREARLAVRIDPARFAPPQWSGWTFGDLAATTEVIERLRADGDRLELAPEDLDAHGAATWRLDLAAALAKAGHGVRCPWTLSAAASVLEAGGRAVTSGGHQLQVDPLPAYLGLRVVAPVGADLRARLEAQLVATDGAAAIADHRLEARLYRESWNTVLVSDHGHYSYRSDRLLEAQGAVQAVALVAGHAELASTLPGPGSFVLRVVDLDSGEVVSLAVSAGLGQGWEDSVSREHPDRCEVTVAAGLPQPLPAAEPGAAEAGAAKPGSAEPGAAVPGAAAPATAAAPAPPLRVGGTALVTVRSPFPGRALISVESDRVIATRVVDLAGGNAITIAMPVTAAWSPNAYVGVTVVRPVDAAAAWGAHRAYGVARATVAQDDRRLAVAVAAPDELRPGTTLALDVEVRGADGLPAAGAALTVAAVDEGILRLTGFATPDPWRWFAAPRGLAVLASDGYDLLLPEVPRLAGESPVGGDATPEGPRYRPPVAAKRVRSVALWSGALRAGADGRAHLELPVPATFNGRLRLMAVAARGAASGSGERGLPVRAPLMVQTSWPRFAAPGDHFTVPVTVFNHGAADGIARIALGLPTDGPLGCEAAVLTLPVPAGRDATARLALTAASRCGLATATVSVELGGERARDEVELPVRPAAPAISIGDELVLSPGPARAAALPEGLLPGTTRVEARIGQRPALALPRGLDYLYRYPHGCAEQTISGCFPLIALRDLGPALAPGLFPPAGVAERLRIGLLRLQCLETADGGLATWPGEREAWPWATVYGAHFLVEAKAAGQAVPEALLARLLAYAGRLGARNDETWMETQCYAAYVLALAGTPDPALMNRLDQRLADPESERRAGPSCRFLLSAAWLAAGRRDRALPLIPARLPEPRGQRHLDGDLASPVRDRAILLSTLLALVPDHPALPRLAQELADQRRWLSTQDTAFAVMALGRYLRATRDAAPFASARLLVDGVAVTDGEPAWSGTSAGALSASIAGAEGAHGWFSWLATGVPLAPPPAADHGLEVRRVWLAEDGTPLPAAPLPSGTPVVVELTVRAALGHRNVVVEDLLPAGFEVENPRLLTNAASGGAAGVVARAVGGQDWLRVDLRDDRVIVIGDLRQQPHGNGFGLTHRYLVRAVTPGRFALPPVRAECLYDLSVSSLSGAGTVTVAPGR